ncbi:hypothetical protein NQZ79_g538 [Umbelopsis isabellina]|nr:hypothetical protein NQZ79_g538 [Umbelopsis isabellina]
MAFVWTEINNNGDYTINEEYQNGVQKCPECCIGGDLMSSQFVFNNTMQMTCKQGIKVYYCTSATPTELLTFACNETSLLNSILLSETSANTSAVPTAVAAHTATPSSMSLFVFSSAAASASASVGISSSASGGALANISANPAAKASTSDSVVNTVPLLAIVLLSIMILLKQMSSK